MLIDCVLFLVLQTLLEVVLLCQHQVKKRDQESSEAKQVHFEQAAPFLFLVSIFLFPRSFLYLLVSLTQVKPSRTSLAD